MILSSKQGAVTVLSVDVTLDADAGDQLRAAVRGIPRVGRPQLVIDLSQSQLIDSAGCEALLDARDEVLDVGGDCVLAGASPLCADILAIAGLDEQLATFHGANEAVASFAR
ncbi:MAG: STAS domain-containing protein [Planctomycetota bacterium]